MLHRLSRVTMLVTAVVLALAGCVIGAQSGPSEVPSRALSTTPPAANRSAAPTKTGNPSPQVATGGSVCSPSNIRLILTSDRTDYRAGEAVTFTATVTNAGGTPCDLPTGICLPQIQIEDGNGTLVWDRAGTVVVCPFGPPSAMAPGSTVAQTIVWDGTACAGRTPESCPGRPVPGGTYRATANWNGADASMMLVVGT